MVRRSQRTLPLRQPGAGSAVPQMSAGNWAGGGHCHGADPHAAVDLVLGRLPRFEPYARHFGRPIPAPTWLEPLRDGVPDPPQTPRRHGPTRSRPHRWPAAGSRRDRRVMGRWLQNAAAKAWRASSELGYRQNHHQIWCSWVSTGQAWLTLREKHDDGTYTPKPWNIRISIPVQLVQVH